MLSTSRSPSIWAILVASSATRVSDTGLDSIASSALTCGGVMGPSPPVANRSWKPRMMLIGVRSSCEATLMNSVFMRATSSRLCTYDPLALSHLLEALRQVPELVAALDLERILVVAALHLVGGAHQPLDAAR